MYSYRMCVVSACLNASESRFFSLFIYLFCLDHETDDEAKGLLSDSEESGKEHLKKLIN